MIPTALLGKVYATGSLANVGDGVRFEIVNRLMNIQEVAVKHVAVDGAPVAMDGIRLERSDVEGTNGIDVGQPFSLPLNARIAFLLLGRELPKGVHRIEIGIEVRPFGEMRFTVEDAIDDNCQPGAETTGPTPAAKNSRNGGDRRPTIRKVKDAQRVESRDSLETLYDTGVRLLTSSMDTYIDAQKRVLNMAIREAEEGKIIGKPTAEAVQGVVAELTTSLELIRKGAEDFADAGKLLLDASRGPRK
jgi:hypothetical protein